MPPLLRWARPCWKLVLKFTRQCVIRVPTPTCPWVIPQLNRKCHHRQEINWYLCQMAIPRTCRSRSTTSSAPRGEFPTTFTDRYAGGDRAEATAFTTHNRVVRTCKIPCRMAARWCA